ncbi:MAG: 3'(2'),5'-bisphosphate nucleotidase CysQ [Pseudomonadota bacterium]
MPATDLPLLIDAVRVAGRIACAHAGKVGEKWDKPDGAGPVTEADLAVNRYLEKTLRLARPEYGWLSEETEDGADRLSRDRVFIVDPIDGTRSFVDGSRTWAHSVAITENGLVTAGVIFLPQRSLLYTAARGSGAQLNGQRIRVSACAEIENAEVLAAKPALAPQHWKNDPPGFGRAYRPSLAYRLGLVAQGRFDAMMTLRPTWEWDIAAGTLIIKEAGGACSDRTGAPLRFNSTNAQVNGVIAAGPTLHGQLLHALEH